MASKTTIAVVREHLKDGTINTYIEDLKEQLLSETIRDGVEQIPTQIELEVATAMRDGTFVEED